MEWLRGGENHYFLYLQENMPLIAEFVVVVHPYTGSSCSKAFMPRIGGLGSVCGYPDAQSCLFVGNKLTRSVV